MDKTWQVHSLSAHTDNSSSIGKAFVEMWTECKKAVSIAAPNAVSGVSAAPVQPQCLGNNDASRTQQTDKVWARVCNYRNTRLQFHAVRGDKKASAFALTDIYKPAGKLTEAFNSSRSKSWGNTQSNLTKAFVICADTFQLEDQSCVRPQVSHSDEMTQVLKWLTPHKDNQTLVILFDGRSKSSRRAFEDWLAEHYPDGHKQADLWITYAGMTADDPREPKRRVAFSDNNRETVFVGLPIAKTTMKAKQRSLFTACGEVSTYSQTYSGVQKRQLQSFPRLAPKEKESMIGKPLEELPNKLVAAAASGHLLFLAGSQTDWPPLTGLPRPRSQPCN